MMSSGSATCCVPSPAQTGHAPLVIAGHVIHRRDADKPAQERLKHGDVGVFVKNITAEADEVGLRLPQRVQKPRIAASEAAAVQVGKLRHAQTVELRRERLERQLDLFDLEREILLEQKQCKACQQRRRQQERQKSISFIHKQSPFLYFSPFFCAAIVLRIKICYNEKKIKENQDVYLV